MRRILVIIVTVLLVSTLYSQNKDLQSELVNRPWSKTDTSRSITFSLTFNTDSTFSFFTPTANNGDTVKVNYQIDESVITFPALGDCQVEGKYKFTINGDELIFQVQNDLCEGRKDVVNGTWKLIKTKNE
jgi:hypothetical protein